MLLKGIGAPGNVSLRKPWEGWAEASRARVQSYISKALLAH